MTIEQGKAKERQALTGGQAAAGELSEEALEQVSGGVNKNPVMKRLPDPRKLREERESK